ncbi:MAG: PIN domain-containing protein [Acidimicrobiales bacterium]
MTTYLADSSIWAWANKRSRPDITEKLATRLERGEVATCVPVALEVMHRAETGAQYEQLFEDLLSPLRWLDLDERSSRRALEVQRQLARGSHGNHRRPAADYLIAAVAELAEATVVTWFFDRDLRVICEHTSQGFESESTTGAGH